MLQYLIVLLLVIQHVNCSLPKDLIVETGNGGKIQGIEEESTWSKQVFVSFKGIPYAKPPIEELRFQPPEKHKGWSEIRESKYSESCPQLSYTEESEVEGSEDCLYLNVFVPKRTRNDKKLPVLLFIHGGGFQFESGSIYGPNYWMEEDIILVTFNYRLGILGFLKTTDGTTIPGNMGMKDQVLVLKWVQENIELFGGDKNQVTLMGVSSGAASVHLHMLSKQSEGLFQAAISQSGVALSPWAICKGDKTARIEKNTGCTKNTTEEYVACLKEMPVEDLVKSQAKFAEWFIDPLVPVGPVVEKDHPGAFITKSPYRIIRENKFKQVPWILGVNSEEGLLHVTDILKNPMLTHVLQWEWLRSGPITLILNGNTFDTDSIMNRIREFYYGEQRIGRNTFEQMINMYSDRYFFHGTHHAAKLHSQASSKEPIYLYLFDYKGKGSEILSFKEVDTNEDKGEEDEDAEVMEEIGKGVGHYDQLQYLFNSPYFPELEDPEHIEMSHQLRKTFTEFIKARSIKTWVKVSKKSSTEDTPLKYNVIGSSPAVIDEPWTDRVKFWDTLSLLELDKEMDSILQSFNLEEDVTSTKDEL